MGKLISIEAKRRSKVALKCVDDLLPGLPPRRRKLMAARILTMLGDESRGGPPVPVKIVVPERRRMTPAVLEELIRIHSSCVHDQEGRCGLLLSVRSLTWEVNQFCNIGDEEDWAFKRRDPMLAARPLKCPFEEVDP